MVRRALLLPVVAALAACEFGRTPVAPPPPTVVVHAVLNPDASETVILVEETLTGRIAVNDSQPFNPADPIVSGGGQPISGATVFLGDGKGYALAFETEILTSSGRRGTGSYVVGTAIVPGRRYVLDIRTPDGRRVSGSTLVPGDSTSPPGGGIVPADVRFDRGRDTLRLTWPAVPGARTYAIRVETPRGPWFLFSDSTRFDLAGTLRNFFAQGIPSVWYPGFSQRVTVSAVDSNFFDYYRSGNDPFGGTGLINRLQGGIGLFGAAKVVLARNVAVGQGATSPFDGRWVGGADTLDLWLETPDPKISTVSGRLQSPRAYLLGTLEGSALRLAVLDTLSRDTVGVFTGTVGTGTISGSYRAGLSVSGSRTWTRVGPPVSP